MVAPEILEATTWHGRIGAVRHAFEHRIDLVLIDPEAAAEGPFFRRDRWGVASVHDADHGGPRGRGEGAPWARRAFADAAVPADCRLLLLTQPRWFGAVFNPVSFWFALRGDALMAVIAEVNNTYGDRHCYLCARPDRAPIAPGDVITVAKVFHVSPFQDVAGRYVFSFEIRDDAIAIRIALRDGAEGLVATLRGRRRPLSRAAVLRAAARFPYAGGRALALIHWQALRLWLKGAPFRSRPRPPSEEITE
ncbi:MAG: DUF1365 domain-containing protein [Rhodovulum sulfidophilum]|uniref:DUF1365 domain-containing protein n=1 Tax=Rhodovulum sulfidophilum TaxID=35806 RepID=A0A2W5N9S8_RHOSU|nr:MAG: DUF1365 domain-containing protein [Rhodovulum sulfidophilum]